MPRARFTSYDVVLYALVVFAWGFSWIALHYQVGIVAPEVSVMWRFAIAAPVMLVIALLRGEKMAYPPSDHFYFAALGLTLFSTNFTLTYYSGQYLPSGLLAVVFSLAAVINIPLSAIFLGTAIDRRVVIGGILGVCGIAAMFYPQIAGTQLNTGALIGLAFSSAGILFFCSGNILSGLLQKRGITVFAASGYGMIYGSLLLAIFAALRGKAFAIDPTLPYLAALAFLSLIASVVAFGSYLTLLGRIGADRAAYSAVVFPVVALGVSTFMENYRWTLPALLGLIAVFAGNLLVLRPGKK